MKVSVLKKAIAMSMVVSAMSVTAFAADKTSDESLDITSKVIPTVEQATPETSTFFSINSATTSKSKDSKHTISVEARYFAPHLKADLKSDSFKMLNNGGEINLKSTLGYKNETAPELRFKYDNLEVDYIHLHNKGNSDLSSTPISFDNKTYNGKTETKGNFDYVSARINRPLANDGMSKVTWNYGLNFYRFDAELNGETTTGHSTKDKNLLVAIPTVGVGVSSYLTPSKNISVYANLTGLPLGGHGYFYDAEAGLNYSPTSQWNIKAGYRVVDANVRFNSDTAEYKLDGPYAGVEFLF